jgi:hypothetical protein
MELIPTNPPTFINTIHNIVVGSYHCCRLLALLSVLALLSAPSIVVGPTIVVGPSTFVGS